MIKQLVMCILLGAKISAGYAAGAAARNKAVPENIQAVIVTNTGKVVSAANAGKAVMDASAVDQKAVIEAPAVGQKDQSIPAVLQSFFSSIVHSKPVNRTQHLVIGEVGVMTLVAVLYKHMDCRAGDIVPFLKNCKTLFSVVKLGLFYTACVQALQYVLPPEGVESVPEQTFWERLKSRKIDIAPDTALGLGICSVSTLILYKEQSAEDLLKLSW